jgi:hypothetical protein
MPAFTNLLDTVLEETLKCQDPKSKESLGRRASHYGPLGPSITDPSVGSYPTTDAAMSALAELADLFVANDPNLRRTHSRDAVRKEVAHVTATLLHAIGAESDANERWKLLRDALKSRLEKQPAEIMHYFPAWVFVRQSCSSFAIGPVNFVQRTEWLAEIEKRRGETSKWMQGVKERWNGTRTDADDEAPPSSNDLNIRAVARAVDANQWVACVLVKGFEKDESRRRGLLAARVAIDTIRLVVPARVGHGLGTAMDHSAPRNSVKLTQLAGQDLALGWSSNPPGVSGAPGMAESLVKDARVLFDAAGRCLEVATLAGPSHGCPGLAERWFNAVHWFGRACAADADFTAVVMYIFALDVLCGGRQQRGIVELVARLTGTALSAHVLPGRTLTDLVNEHYRMRSEIAHGSILAVFEDLDEHRAVLSQLAQAALIEYAIKLDAYAQAGGSDDRDAFRDALPAATP